MIRWILTVAVGLITLYTASWSALLLGTVFAPDGQLIVATEGTALNVISGGITVTQGTARVVGVTKPVLVLLVVWYVVLAVLAMAGVWSLASRRAVPKSNA